MQLAEVRELAQLKAARSWRQKFHSVSELPDGDTIFLIDQILPEGITFLGALSGVGKTWLALSMSRALTKGGKFLGVWNVPEPSIVLYLCPEMSAKTFKNDACAGDLRKIPLPDRRRRSAARLGGSSAFRGCPRIAASSFPRYRDPILKRR